MYMHMCRPCACTDPLQLAVPKTVHAKNRRVGGNTLGEVGKPPPILEALDLLRDLTVALHVHRVPRPM